MTWTIEDAAGVILLALAITSTWYAVCGQLTANRRQKEQAR
ncbi:MULTISPECIES: hypothetical protein [unclassified Pseudomonas]|nr:MULTISPECIES: hypothetical protein [unclassified Pseudomonas]